MAEIRRPVFFCGENPGMTLFIPGTQQTTVVASYWHCTDSPHGVGHALVVWLSDKSSPKTKIGSGGVFTDNPALAQVLVQKLTRYFPEFEEVPVINLPILDAKCSHSFDGEKYIVTCKTPATNLVLEWSIPLDRKQIFWPGFQAGEFAYDLTTVICPCRLGQLTIDKKLISGEVQTETTQDGHLSSSAFLAFSETWLGPLDEAV